MAANPTATGIAGAHAPALQHTAHVTGLARVIATHATLVARLTTADIPQGAKLMVHACMGWLDGRHVDFGLCKLIEVFVKRMCACTSPRTSHQGHCV